MKKAHYICSILSLLFITTACEEVVDLNLPTAAPRLVVEANLDFSTSVIDTISPYIKLSLTTDYYATEIPKVHQAQVWVETENGNRFQFKEHNDTGYYYSNMPQPNNYETLNLHIEYLNEVYEAKERFYPSPEITTRQNIKNYFGKDYFEVAVDFEDFPTNEFDENNYYLVERQRNEEQLSLAVQNNSLTQGNILYSTYLDEDTQVNDVINFKVYQISKTYYNFLYQLIESINNGGGPFQTPTGQVRGNVRNKTNSENYPLGYFRVTQKKSSNHLVEAVD